MKPLAIDLFCGLGGWTEALLAEDWRVVGFDIERHDYGTGVYPGQLVIQDVTTIHGSQFKDAQLIVASPPCQEYSYMAMPWSRSKQIARALRGEGDFPEGYTGSRTVAELTRLFDACFRIQREAEEAAGRHIPLIVENVRGAIPWVSQPCKWHFGSFYLFGDVPALMPLSWAPRKSPSNSNKRLPGAKGGRVSGWPHIDEEGQKANPDGTEHPPGSWFKIADSKNRGARSNGAEHEGARVAEKNDDTGRKMGGDWFSDPTSTCRRHGSKSNARKAASAHIAKIPEPLARHIARSFYPAVEEGTGDDQLG